MFDPDDSPNAALGPGAGRWSSGALLLALALHACLSALYLVGTPVYEAPDEAAHHRYVQSLADGSGLPLILGSAASVGRPPLAENALGHHPPLYYGLLAVVERSLFPDGCRPTPKPRVEKATWPEGPRLRWQHAHDEVAPRSSEVRRFYVLRAVSILLGAVTLVATHSLGRRVFPAQPAVANWAVIGLALLPSWSASHAALGNDVPVAALATTALAVLSSTQSRTGLQPGRAFVFGLLAGAAICTKYTAFYLLPLAAIFGIFVSWRAVGARDVRVRSALCTAVAVVTPLICLAPLIGRNLRLYGDALGQDLYRAAYTVSEVPDGHVFGYLTRLFPRWTLESFVARFGVHPVAPPFWSIAVWSAILLLALAGYLRRPRKTEARREAEAESNGLTFQDALLLFLAIAGPALIYLRFNLTYRQPQARYLLAALGPAALVLSLGLLRLSGKRRRLVGGLVFVAALGTALQLALIELPTRMRFDAAAAGPVRATLTAHVASPAGGPLVEALAPADNTVFKTPPTFRWSQDLCPASLYLSLASADLHGGSFESLDMDPQATEFTLPDAMWSLIPEGWELEWKVRRLPDRERGENVDDVPETRPRVVRRRVERDKLVQGVEPPGH